MGTLLNRANSLPLSPRSSFDDAPLAQRECRVAIYDQQDSAASQCLVIDESYVNRFRLPHRPSAAALPSELSRCLDRRNARHTRWINIEGWSPGLADDLTNRFLENHGCLHLDDLGQQTLGGPIRRADSSYFIWLQTSIWYASQEAASWSFMKPCRLRVVVCLPTSTTAGTVITNFLGDPSFAERVSNAFTQELLDNHSMGTEALTCVWALVFSILRLTAQQLNIAWRTFDPLDGNASVIPESDNLAHHLQSANHLARIDRYISGLDEIVAFFDAVRHFQNKQRPSNCNEQEQNLASITARSELESTLAKDRIGHARQMCRTYIQQYESQTSLVSLYPDHHPSRCSRILPPDSVPLHNQNYPAAGQRPPARRPPRHNRNYPCRHDIHLDAVCHDHGILRHECR
jgi:hypothetical protein